MFSFILDSLLVHIASYKILSLCPKGVESVPHENGDSTVNAMI